MKVEKKTTAEKIVQILFFLYVLFIIKVIIFKFSWEQMNAIVNSWQKGVIWEGLSTANFEPFKTIKLYIRYYSRTGINSFENLFGNILVFIPFGYLLTYVHPICRNILILLANSFLFIIGIEVFQLFSAFGAFDVDDIILNCFGAIIGYLLFIIFHKKRNH